MAYDEEEMSKSSSISEDIELFSDEQSTSVRQDPVIKKLLGKLPDDIADSYSEKQLQGLRVALGDRTWGKHFIDRRGTFAITFVRWRFYYVFLLGKNRRAYTRREKHASLLMFMGLILLFLCISVLLGLLTLYLLKSALGIDLLEGTSLGAWDWFKELW
ncbi:conserved hypothetical protein [Shewanella sediminis HAW-EB3]|uniref:3-phosphoshikimate 1-carboxyvinyltransferase n=1 Tax=Shewanella sediminis (strain HAW-EB3) TaxID=425104 RepID=A8FSX6_SHESH|nr:hypothetical protein [Shewanella sediminis]ABV35949.1 conserved hypothetical protein [Shewanella sediminis HAW-EB3]